MSTTHTSSGDYIQEVTVYADVRDEALIQHIKSCAERLCPNARIVTVASLDAQNANHNNEIQLKGIPPFLRLWESEKGDFARMVQNTVPLMQQLACFITEKQDMTKGEVVYAVHRMQMPVLALTTTTNTNNTSSTASRLAVTEKILFTTRPSEQSAQEAIERFFAFPQSSPGRMVAIETEGNNSRKQHVLEQLHAHCSAEKMLPLIGPAYTGFTLLDSACFPLTMIGKAASGCSAPPATAAAFDDLLQKLTSGAHGKTTTGPDGEGPFIDLLRANPQLYGALSAFNRYENRGLVRYLLQRGHALVVVDHLSTTAAPLLDALRTEGSSSAPPPLREHLESLMKFESHWLEMAVPAQRVCIQSSTSGDWISVVRAEEAATAAADGSSTSLLKDWAMVTAEALCTSLVEALRA